jgi:hypothetical protein
VATAKLLAQPVLIGSRLGTEIRMVPLQVIVQVRLRRKPQLALGALKDRHQPDAYSRSWKALVSTGKRV